MKTESEIKERISYLKSYDKEMAEFIVNHPNDPGLSEKYANRISANIKAISELEWVLNIQ